jgi:hypothetical protein
MLRAEKRNGTKQKRRIRKISASIAAMEKMESVLR